MLAALLVLVLPTLSRGHAAMTFPKPRNAGDGRLAPWSEWAYPCDATHKGDDCRIHFCESDSGCAGACPITAGDGTKGELDASNGQACYWFSNGCTVGCDECDGTSNHVGHGNQKFLYNGMNSHELNAANRTIPNPFSPPRGKMVLNPATRKGLEIKPNCANPRTTPTICAESLRTANTQAECGGPDDIYYWSPWRAPGSAPVVDACGSAGGRFPNQGTGGAGASFENSTFAREGDLGSKLPAGRPAAVWTPDKAWEVGWTVMANHGGGYSYRLAPADGPLTEEEFRKMPLDFEGNSTLMWDRVPMLEFNASARGWETSEGTVPVGSTWRKNPIPSGLWEREGAQFEPVCEESEACLRTYTTGPWIEKPGVCKCSGFSNGGPLLPNLEIVDLVRVPASLAPGKYVLQWRWDCEESDQVWASCADIEVIV